MKENKETIIVGDFNINYNDSLDNTEIKSVINQQGLKQMVQKSTRITSTSSTLIDLVITNKPSNLWHVEVVSTSLSDHDMIACIRKIHSHKQAPKVIKCRNYINYDANKMNEDVPKIYWEPIYGTNDVSASLQFFCSKLKAIFDYHAPFVLGCLARLKSP